jgi:hypothetical protein
MTCCTYCGEQATEDIPAVPGRVCRTHAQEFWTGLLTYVKSQSKPVDQPETPCECGVCNDMSMVKLRMIAAGAAAGPPPGDAGRAPIAAIHGIASRERIPSHESIASHESAVPHDRHDSGFLDPASLETPGAVTAWRTPDALSVRSA